MIYFDQSPDYCTADPNYNIIGIAGRECTCTLTANTASSHIVTISAVIMAMKHSQIQQKRIATANLCGAAIYTYIECEVCY